MKDALQIRGVVAECGQRAHGFIRVFQCGERRGGVQPSRQENDGAYHALPVFIRCGRGGGQRAQARFNLAQLPPHGGA